MGRFDGKVALVTGASRGIGLAVARELVDGGADVIITARGEEDLKAAAGSLGASALPIAGKADREEHRREVFGTIQERFGGLDYLVNNVGINPVYGPMTELEDTAARKILEVNVLGAFNMARDAVKAGLRDRRGAIVNIASIAGVTSSPGIGM